MNMELDAMELELSDFAACWRGAAESARGEIVLHYHAILRCMIELGFNQALDLDSELPRRLMPQEYLALF